jgi:hypothetical protein
MQPLRLKSQDEHEINKRHGTRLLTYDDGAFNLINVV